MPTKSEKQERRWVQFSKILTSVYTVIMLPLSVYTIWKCLTLAELAILNQYTGSLPYITAIVGFVESAMTIVLGFYFKNSEKEKIARIGSVQNNRDC